MHSCHSAFAAAFVLCIAACTPPAAQSQAGDVVQVTEDAAATEVVAAATRAVEADLGQPVSLQVDTIRIDGDWAWLVALPRSASGGAFDFSGTRYAEAAAAGAFDGGGTTYILAQRGANGWEIRDFVIGPTDVAYMDWPQRYGAPPDLLGLPAE